MESKGNQDRSSNGAADDQDGFAEEVRRALAPVPAPDGFTERVMARAARDPVGPAAQTQGKLLRFTPRVRLLYAAAALLALTAGGAGVEHRVQQHRAAEAAAQFDVALQVTGNALAHVSAQLERTELGAVERALESSSKEKE